MVPRRSVGWERMRAFALSLPTDLRDGFARGRDTPVRFPERIPEIVGVGMGGSAIALDLAAVLLQHETPVRFRTLRSPKLPPSVSRESLVLLSSYSGETWETLAAYAEAGRRGARRIVLASGGELARRAIRDRVPHLTVPAGRPPRATVGHQLGLLLGLFDSTFPQSNDDRIARIADHLVSAVPAIAGTRGLAHRLARRVGRRWPVVVASAPLGPVARRWKTQVEENAKRLAFFDEAPELLHNSLVGVDGTSAAQGRSLAYVFLQWEGSVPKIRRGLDFLARIARSHGFEVIPVSFHSPDLLETIVEATAVGDHFSLSLAAADGVDPYPVDVIQALKRALARTR